MKFANLTLEHNKGMENVGDWAQILAIEHLYQYMGVSYQEVIRVKVSELSTYSGEYVILPINYPFYGYYKLSPKIIPVYLGISIIHRSVAEGLRMKNFQPIGCRDFHTWKELTELGLEAYMTGCLTITWPKRKVDECKKKIFIVDVSENVYKKIPDDIRLEAQKISHVHYLDECNGEEGARNIYKMYEKEAKLVITSRIHCAQPCLAMGIPVIFICEVQSFRYDVIRQYIPVYSLETMDQIDWSPKAPDLEAQKELLLQNAAYRIRKSYEKYQRLCEISDFYLQGNPIEKEVDSVWAFQRYIRDKYKKNDRFSYSLWGITQIAEAIYEWVKMEYPNAVLDHVFDISNRNEFHGIMPQPLEQLQGSSSVVFVTAGSANSVALEVFEKYGIKDYVICYNGMYVISGVRYSY